MTRISMARRAVHQADSLGAVLEAAYEVFEATMAGIRVHEDSTGDSFAAFAFAAASAADGRDAIAAAPALSWNPRGELPADAGSTVSRQKTAELAAELAALSEMLAARLAQAAGSAAGRADRAACWEGARNAREIHVLLAGSPP